MVDFFSLKWYNINNVWYKLHIPNVKRYEDE